MSLPLSGARVVMIGAGNVATSLARALAPLCHIEQIYSRALPHAQALAAAVGCPNAICELADVASDADMYIISVSDDAIAAVVEAVPDNGALWVHTSGSKPIGLFEGRRARYGVLYPMQSFVKRAPTGFSQVPFFVEGSDPGCEADIMAVARALSERVYTADSDTRRTLHIAAVFCCNFANHLWALADDLLRREGIAFDVMLPLIRATVDKLELMPPAQAQTGPAARRDYEVLTQHLSTLSGDKHEVYDILSKSIIRFHHSQGD